MKYVSRQVTFAEVPDEICLSYLISGCQLRCKGCHSADAWNAEKGLDLSLSVLSLDINKYRKFITCVLFLGGEWHFEELLKILQFSKSFGLKTCLYTGEKSVHSALVAELDYLKTGPYIQSLGGLRSENTNQRLINVKTNECLNYLFLTNEGVRHGSI